EDGRAGAGASRCVRAALGNAPFTRVEHAITPGGALLLVINDLPGALRSRGQSRRTGKLVTGDGGNPTARDLADLIALADGGQLRPVIDRTYDLADIVDAHRYVDTGRKVGSVVLRIGAS
ncbi:zinc-binding dehydrogenase, partial [Microbacterium sp.]|uniref:zinc-binding dehydrogenase n=1 Tax=Microbacterium sp. TaxID=51671 RepID=UPI003F9650E3